MATGVVFTALVLLFFAIFAYYKRDMLIKMFSLRLTEPASQFQEELERTTDAVIKRLEERIEHLEFLLVEAEEKIVALDGKISLAEKTLQQQLPAIPAGKLIPVSHQIAQYKMNDRFLPPAEAAPVVISPAADMVTEDRAPVKEMMSNDKRCLILTMADQGYNVTEIAKATGMGKGEIMLLLQLNKK